MTLIQGSRSVHQDSPLASATVGSHKTIPRCVDSNHEIYFAYSTDTEHAHMHHNIVVCPTSCMLAVEVNSYVDAKLS